MGHQAGFVSIIGKPNVGKSTLINALVGEPIAIVTSKAQTTRHRIAGIINDKNYQIILSDTPGVIEASYRLQANMMHTVNDAIIDADVILLVTDLDERNKDASILLQKLKGTSVPVAILINKMDLSNEKNVKETITTWQTILHTKAIFAISALLQYNMESILYFILDHLPEHPPYYEKNIFTTRSKRFLASEIIREKIFNAYHKEIPYSTEVMITNFQEQANIIHIDVVIIVERVSQKIILIGSYGSMLKKVGIQARKDLEQFFQKKIFLKSFVKVITNWRNKEQYLNYFGYRS